MYYMDSAHLEDVISYLIMHLLLAMSSLESYGS